MSPPAGPWRELAQHVMFELARLDKEIAETKKLCGRNAIKIAALGATIPMVTALLIWLVTQ